MTVEIEQPRRLPSERERDGRSRVEVNAPIHGGDSDLRPLHQETVTARRRLFHCWRCAKCGQQSNPFGVDADGWIRELTPPDPAHAVRYLSGRRGFCPATPGTGRASLRRRMFPWMLVEDSDALFSGSPPRVRRLWRTRPLLAGRGRVVWMRHDLLWTTSLPRRASCWRYEKLVDSDAKAPRNIDEYPNRHIAFAGFEPLIFA